MNQQLFRQKSLDRISSPEQLDEYIRVSNPGIWMILGAIIILLVGVCVWGIVGHLDTTLPVVAVSQNGETVLCVKESQIASVAEGMIVSIGETQCAVTAIASQPVNVDGVLTEYALHLGGFQQGEWAYIVTTDARLSDGAYSARIVIESIAPMTFLVN